MKNEKFKLLLFVLLLTLSYSTNKLNATLVNVNFKVQGYYKPSTNLLAKPLPVTIELHNPAFPFALVATVSTMVNIFGSASASFSVAAGSYYIAIKGYNVLETWSKATPVIPVAGTVTYDFAVNTDAFGDNMTLLEPGVWGFYVGDFFQTGFIGGGELAAVTADAVIFKAGDVITDVNGDFLVDGSDVLIIDNNAYNFVAAVTP